MQERVAECVWRSLMGRDDLNEGHGFSRAVDADEGRTASDGVRFLQGSLRVDLSMGRDVPQGLKPSMAGGFMARLKPCPSLRFLCYAKAQ